MLEKLLQSWRNQLFLVLSIKSLLASSTGEPVIFVYGNYIIKKQIDFILKY